jgi:hypothetical protein
VYQVQIKYFTFIILNNKTIYSLYFVIYHVSYFLRNINCDTSSMEIKVETTFIKIIFVLSLVRVGQKQRTRERFGSRSTNNKPCSFQVSLWLNTITNDAKLLTEHGLTLLSNSSVPQSHVLSHHWPCLLIAAPSHH